MGIAWTDLVAASLHGLRQRKGRSLLILLGMMTGTGSIVLLAGLLAGGQEALISTSQFIAEADVIQVVPAAAPPVQRRRTQRPLDRADQEALDGSPATGGGAAEGEVFDARWAEAGTRRRQVLVLGASERARALYRVTLARGRFIDGADLEQHRRVCVVGDSIWRELLGAPEDLGRVSLRLGGTRWEVVGVLRHKPMLSGGPGMLAWDSRVLVPATTLQAVTRRSHRVDAIYIRLPPGPADLPARIDRTRRLIKAALAQRHYGVENFRVGDDQGARRQGDLILLLVHILVLSGAALSLLVGGINIMNIMLVAVTERTREIGIRRALGASRASIVVQFLLEAASLGGLGGLLGVAGGAALVLLTSRLLSMWLGSWTSHYEPWSILLGLGSSILVGLAAGVYPACRAMGLDVVEALRQE